MLDERSYVGLNFNQNVIQPLLSVDYDTTYPRADFTRKNFITGTWLKWQLIPEKLPQEQMTWVTQSFTDQTSLADNGKVAQPFSEQPSLWACGLKDYLFFGINFIWSLWVRWLKTCERFDTLIVQSTTYLKTHNLFKWQIYWVTCRFMKMKKTIREKFI